MTPTEELFNEMNRDLLKAYNTIESKGGDVPADRNTNNLATAVASIDVNQGGGGDEPTPGPEPTVSHWGTITYTEGGVSKTANIDAYAFFDMCEVAGDPYAYPPTPGKPTYIIVDGKQINKADITKYESSAQVTRVPENFMALAESEYGYGGSSPYTNLKEVVFAEETIEFGDNVLKSAPALTTVTLLGKVDSIGNRFCYGCSALTTFNATSIRKIGEGILGNNRVFDSPVPWTATLEEYPTRFIAALYVFNQPIVLTHFPTKQSSINYAFIDECTKFNSTLTFDMTPEQVQKELYEENRPLPMRWVYRSNSFNQPVTFPEGMKNIPAACGDCPAFNSKVNLPSTAEILDLMLAGTYNQPLTIPSSVRIIRRLITSTAYNQVIDLPEGVEEISGPLISGSTAYNQPITLPNSLKDVSTLFENCSKFNQPITIPENVESVGNLVSGCAAFNSSITFNTTNLTSLGGGFLQKCTAFNQPLELPETLEGNVGGFLFGCTAFDQPINFPDGITSLGSSDTGSFSYNVNNTVDQMLGSGSYSYGPFIGCLNLNSPVKLPANLKIMGYCGFADCRAFNQKLDLPEGLTTIGGLFLQRATSFNQDLAIPSTVNTLGFAYSYTSNCDAGILNGASSMTGTITVNTTYSRTVTTAAGEGQQYSFAVTNTSSDMYAQGVKITGPGADTWMAMFPNGTFSGKYGYTGTFYRKLVKG